jgi:hypothetical protein
MALTIKRCDYVFSAHLDGPMTKKANPQLEFEPNAWKSFERAVDVVAKSPPQHRIAKATKSMTPKRARVQSKRRKKSLGQHVRLNAGGGLN